MGVARAYIMSTVLASKYSTHDLTVGNLEESRLNWYKYRGVATSLNVFTSLPTPSGSMLLIAGALALKSTMTASFEYLVADTLASMSLRNIQKDLSSEDMSTLFTLCTFTPLSKSTSSQIHCWPSIVTFPPDATGMALSMYVRFAVSNCVPSSFVTLTVGFTTLLIYCG